MTEPEPRAEKAAKILNAAMFCAVVLAVTLYAAWVFAADVGPVLALWKGLSAEGRAVLGQALKSFAFVVVGAALLWRATRPIRGAIGQGRRQRQTRQQP